MTQHHREPDNSTAGAPLPPVPPHLEVLADWIDGEPVARADVLAALGSDEGQEYIVDVVALRRIVTVTTPTQQRQPARSTRPAWHWFATAAAIVVCAAGGYAAGRFNTGAATAQPAPAIVEDVQSSAPDPTHVFRLEPGIDWNETTGGD